MQPTRLVFGTVDLPDTALAGRLLDRFYAGGGRALDVANVYRDGESAAAVGRWLHGRRGLEGIVVYAKGCHPPFCSPELVAPEVEAARRLLGVEVIDVFILHRDDLGVPVSVWADALLEQVAAGTIRAFGVSNWTVARFGELHAHLGRIGATGLAAFSNHFSLAEMVSPPWPGCLAVSRDDLAAIAGTGAKMLAWSSLATGYFAGRDTPHWDSPPNRARRVRAAELAQARGVPTPSVALSYVLHQPDFVLPVVGTRSEAHLEEALAATQLELSRAERAWLETGTRAPSLAGNTW